MVLRNRTSGKSVRASDGHFGPFYSFGRVLFGGLGPWKQGDQLSKRAIANRSKSGLVSAARQRRAVSLEDY